MKMTLLFSESVEKSTIFWILQNVQIFKKGYEEKYPVLFKDWRMPESNIYTFSENVHFLQYIQCTLKKLDDILQNLQSLMEWIFCYTLSEAKKVYR